MASGGVYTPVTPTAEFDFVEPYLRHIPGFIGLTDLTSVKVEGAGQL